jgi:hypothetical protein
MRSFLTELFSLLLGPMTPASFIAVILFFLIGSTLNIGIDLFNRDKQSTNTPAIFSWRFFLRDNRLRLPFNLLAAYSLLRFTGDVFPALQFNLAYAWMLGLISDWIWVALREIKYMAMSKLKNTISKLKNK